MKNAVKHAIKATSSSKSAVALAKSMTIRQFTHSLAGIKASYTRKINRASSAKEAKRLREECAAEIDRRTIEFEQCAKKEVQREAGRKSWVTRRANEQSRMVAAAPEAPMPEEKEDARKAQSPGRRAVSMRRLAQRTEGEKAGDKAKRCASRNGVVVHRRVTVSSARKTRRQNDK